MVNIQKYFLKLNSLLCLLDAKVVLDKNPEQIELRLIWGPGVCVDLCEREGLGVAVRYSFPK